MPPPSHDYHNFIMFASFSIFLIIKMKAPLHGADTSVEVPKLHTLVFIPTLINICCMQDPDSQGKLENKALFCKSTN